MAIRFFAFFGTAVQFRRGFRLFNLVFWRWNLPSEKKFTILQFGILSFVFYSCLSKTFCFFLIGWYPMRNRFIRCADETCKNAKMNNCFWSSCFFFFLRINTRKMEYFLFLTKNTGRNGKSLNVWKFLFCLRHKSLLETRLLSVNSTWNICIHRLRTECKVWEEKKNYFVRTLPIRNDPLKKFKIRLKGIVRE